MVDREKLEADRLGVIENASEVSLVDEVAHEDGVATGALEPHVLEEGAKTRTQLTAEHDSVAARLVHAPSGLQRPG
jgi:hypothetical protein